jgi:hypothetical protein
MGASGAGVHDLTRRRQTGRSARAVVSIAFAADRETGLKSLANPRNAGRSAMLEESGRPGSNRRRPAWEAGILPLNYARDARNRSPIAGFGQRVEGWIDPAGGVQ